MHDRHIAREQIGKLRQKQGGAQIVHQPFVQQRRRGIALDAGIDDGRVDGEIAFAATCGNDHVGAGENVGVALDACGVEREPRGIGADALPGFHLALVALLWDLRVEGQLGHRMNDVRRERRFIDVDRLAVQRIPMRIETFAERSGEADAGDPGFAADRGRMFSRGISHGQSPVGGSR